MPITTAGISNDILSTTIYDIADEVAEGLFQTTPYLSVARKLGKVASFNGGYKIIVPIETAEHSQITTLNSGWEALNLSVTEATDQAEYDYLRCTIPVLISGKEEAMNNGDKAIIDLAEVRYKNALGALTRQINRQIVQGGVVGLTSLGTLNGNTAAAGSTTGFLEDAAPAAQGNLVGGLARAGVVGLQNQYRTAGAFALTDLYDVEALASTVMPAGGDGGRFHLTLASSGAYTAYRNALFANERYIDAKTLDASGVQSLAFSSGVMMPDRDMDVTPALPNAFMLLNLDGIKLAVHSDADFSFEGFENISGYDGRYGKILFMGALCGNHLGSSALITGF